MLYHSSSGHDQIAMSVKLQGQRPAIPQRYQGVDELRMALLFVMSLVLVVALVDCIYIALRIQCHSLCEDKRVRLRNQLPDRRHDKCP